jgi:hypothetical protein
MLYAMLCYGSESAISAWTKDQETEIMGGLRKVEAGLAAHGTLGTSLRLFPTTTATTVRAGDRPLVLDGPFTETKEQLLGFWIMDCPSLDEAIEAGRKLANARGPGAGSLEIRPIAAFTPRDIAP